MRRRGNSARSPCVLIALHGRKARPEKDRVLAVLGIELVNGVIHLPDTLGTQGLAKQIELRVPFPSQVREHHTCRTIEDVWTIEGIEMLVDERHHGRGHVGRPRQDDVIPGMAVVLACAAGRTPAALRVYTAAL